MDSDERSKSNDQPSGELSGEKRRWQDRFVAPLSKTARIMLLLGGVILPILCHLFALEGIPVNGADWQSGALFDRISFILTLRAGFVFYPFMGFSMAALVAYLFFAPKLKKTFWVPLGIVNGVLVSLWYTGVFAVVLTKQESFDPISTALSVGTFAILSMIPIVIWLIFTAIKAVCRKIGQPAYVGGAAFVVLYVAGCCVAVLLGDGNDWLVGGIWAAFLAPFLSGVVFAPIWSLTAYSLAAVRMFVLDRTASQFSLFQLMGLVTYAAGLLTACRTSVWLSLYHYSKLPTVQPAGCYVATAASKGHPWFVGTSKVESNFPINRQLQMLKAFEIAMATLLPSTHRRLRKFYNAIGPILARHIERKLQADIAYAVLKPCEWGAATLLFILLGRKRHVVTKIYVDTGRPSR